MKFILPAIAVVALLGMSVDPANAGRAASYLKLESKRIHSEGNRIKDEANRMLSESRRLKREASELRNEALRLDKMWAKAQQAAPAEYGEYPGRDRSQKHLRADADREDRDSEGLVIENTRLAAEAERLWKLAAAVNAQAQQDLINRMICCKKADIEILRASILSMASELGVQYTPAPYKN